MNPDDTKLLATQLMNYINNELPLKDLTPAEIYKAELTACLCRLSDVMVMGDFVIVRRDRLTFSQIQK